MRCCVWHTGRPYRCFSDSSPAASPSIGLLRSTSTGSIRTGSTEYLADLGILISHLLPGTAADPGAWLYDHFGLGTFRLAQALRLHWLLAYLFMTVGLLYTIGLAWEVGSSTVAAALRRRGRLRDAAVLPRRAHSQATAAPVAASAGHVQVQSTAAHCLPGDAAARRPCGRERLGDAQAGPVEMARGAFVNYEGARVTHFWTMVAFATFVIPHVVLVLADGWTPSVDGHRLVLPGPSAAWTRVIAPVSASGRHSPNGWPSPTSRRSSFRSRRFAPGPDGISFSGAPELCSRGRVLVAPSRRDREHHLTPAMRDWIDSLEARLGADRRRRERFMNRVLTLDDDVAEALYSPTRSVRTYSRSDVTPLRNNYNGATPTPAYLPGWTLTVSGLSSGRVERLGIADMLGRFAHHEQVTRLFCVEGWSAIAWWGGLRFADLLQAYPPLPGARWAKLESSVNLDAVGSPDPYYVSIDLPTARHPQTLLATHLSGKMLQVEHGAPLRLLAPMKLGLKNIKAITSIAYSVEAPADYWNERGYSRYDGL